MNYQQVFGFLFPQLFMTGPSNVDSFGRISWKCFYNQRSIIANKAAAMLVETSFEDGAGCHESDIAMIHHTTTIIVI